MLAHIKPYWGCKCCWGYPPRLRAIIADSTYIAAIIASDLGWHLQCTLLLQQSPQFIFSIFLQDQSDQESVSSRNLCTTAPPTVTHIYNQITRINHYQNIVIHSQSTINSVSNRLAKSQWQTLRQNSTYCGNSFAQNYEQCLKSTSICVGLCCHQGGEKALQIVIVCVVNVRVTHILAPQTVLRYQQIWQASHESP